MHKRDLILEKVVRRLIRTGYSDINKVLKMNCNEPFQHRKNRLKIIWDNTGKKWKTIQITLGIIFVGLHDESLVMGHEVQNAKTRCSTGTALFAVALLLRFISSISAW